MPRLNRRISVLFALLTMTAGLVPAALAQSPYFAAGNLVVAVEGCGVWGGDCTNVPYGTGTGLLNSTYLGYGDNQAAPMTLMQFSVSGTSSVSYVNSLVVPQIGSGANWPFSGEYGSQSEGTIQLSGNSAYLTLLGYGINAEDFNSVYGTGGSYVIGNPATDIYGAGAYSPGLAAGNVAGPGLAQSTSLSAFPYIPVPRVLALIDANGNVNTSTAIYNVFDGNNPRSAYTLDGSTVYVSGQGSSDDATGGVFYVPVGSLDIAPVAITGDDSESKSGTPESQDTRMVQIYDDTLYISTDSKAGSGYNRSLIGTLGTPPNTTLYDTNTQGQVGPGNTGPTPINGFGNGKTGKVTITTGANTNGNNLNNSTAVVNGGKNGASNLINTSPENYFFANSTTLYVADSGAPKNDSNGDNACAGATTNIGDGGIQKWVNTAGTWNLVYTIYKPFTLVGNCNTSGISGFYGLTGMVSGSTVELYATTYGLSDFDTSYLVGVTDTISNTNPAAAPGVTTLATSPAGSNFKGVSFAPSIPAGGVELTTEPSGLSVMSSGAGCAPGTYAAPVTLTWTPDSRCELSVTTPQAGPNGTQYVFTHWQDGATTSTQKVTAPSTPDVYTASFGTEQIVWATPAAITYGTPLSDVQLHARARFNNVDLSGKFTFSPPAGTVLPAGSHTLSVVFTPLNAAKFGTVTASVELKVNPATPEVRWGEPKPIVSGTPLGNTQLDATSPIAGAFSYSPAPSTILTPGTHTLSVLFTPYDTADYTTATKTTTIRVEP